MLRRKCYVHWGQSREMQCVNGLIGLVVAVKATTDLRN